MTFPPEFDPNFYQESNEDLQTLENAELASHYETFGIQEGRWASPYMGREHFLKLVHEVSEILEIGPFFAPALTGSHIRYFDVLDTDDLIKRAQSFKQPTENIPSEIQYVSDKGDLSIVNDLFPAVFSSHCIEHQPNLVRHLNGVERILEPEGSYFLIIPDKRYCFDHHIPTSTIANILEANDDRMTHSLKSVIEHRSFVTHNDAAQHWLGNHGHTASTNIERLAETLTEYENKQEEYIDVHAWQFTPNSFKEILTSLHGLGLTNFTCERVYQTPKDRLEFCAILTKKV